MDVEAERSLERIAYHIRSGDPSNWVLNELAAGGTPGLENRSRLILAEEIEFSENLTVFQAVTEIRFESPTSRSFLRLLVYVRHAGYFADHSCPGER